MRASSTRMLPDCTSSSTAISLLLMARSCRSSTISPRAFNIAGTDDTPGDGVTSWLGWHVLESVPDDVDEFTLTAAFVDDHGRIGMDRITVKVDRSKPSGQALTPAPISSRDWRMKASPAHPK